MGGHHFRTIMDKFKFSRYDFATIGGIQAMLLLFYLNLVKTYFNPQITGLARNSISVTWSLTSWNFTLTKIQSDLSRFGRHRLPLRCPVSQTLQLGELHKCSGFSFPRPSDNLADSVGPDFPGLMRTRYLNIPDPVSYTNQEKSPTSRPLSFGETKAQKNSCMWDISFSF